MKNFLPLFAMILLGATLPAQAQRVFCEPTAGSAEYTAFPSNEHVRHSNNLRRKTGAPDIADGIPMLFIGRVLDANCVPVSGALVQLAQADQAGKWVRMKEDDAAFSGSGEVYTNNLGEFSFLTILPGKQKGELAPTLYLRVMDADLPALHARVLISDDVALATGRNNIANPVGSMDSNMVYRFELVMRGRRVFEKY